MDLNEIQSLIKFVAKSGATEVELETGDFKIVIKTPNRKKNSEPETLIQQVPVAAAPMTIAVPPAAIAAPILAAAPSPIVEKESTSAGDEESKYITIKSPMIGTFYRKANPESDIFVNVGDEISEGKVVCIIEAMKLFNEIEAEFSGKIVKALVDDATPVEYDQPLFLVDPS
ncbi:MAG: acetyl-CoA carboxylase biotin carboxyl carrier protein [Flavobacteriales bacterium]|nr:acetyl-CoA carboxylase biotin carboxyl carrier protein [Flavobacteriales bacterium]